ncbi:MAG: PAS domain S-box protein, partial [Anaerolineales bacterium]
MCLFSSLRFRLVALVLLAILPAMGLAVYDMAREVSRERAHAQERALQGVHLVATAHQNLIASTRQLLAALADLPELRPGRGKECSALLARLLPLHASYANFGAADRNGEVFCSAVPLRAPVNVADRAWFQRALERQDFAAGDYQVGRITGKAVIVFGQPVWEQDQIVAVAFAALDLAWLEGLAQEINLPEGSLYTVMDRQGMILARWPEGSEWVGRTAPEDSILASILGAKTEGTAEATDSDGLRRLYVYAPLWSDDQIVAYLTIGFPIAQTYSAAEANLRFNLLILSMVALFGMLAAWLGGELSLVRPIRGLLAATQRLARGDLSARSGVRSSAGELNQLGRAFDQMAEALESENRQLRRSEERLVEAQALAHLGYWELDLVNDVLHWSDEVFRIFEIDPQQFGASYQAFLERVHPEDRVRVDQAYRESVERHTPYAIEHRLLLPDGRVKYVFERGQTFYDEEGRALRSIGTVQDITERVEQEARYRQLFEGVPVALYRSTPEGKLLEVNPAMVKLLGYPSREALLATHAADLYFDAGERERWQAIMARKGVVENYIARMRRYDGSYIWVEDTARSIRDELGNVLYYEGSLEDITERVEAEQEGRLLLSLTKAIAEAESFDAAIAIALQMICERTGWDFGEVWAPSPQGSHLELRAPYYCRDRALERFRESSRGFTFAPGEGLPGRVWASGKPAWIPDVTQDVNFPRAPHAKEMGLRAAVGVPILDNGSVVAVMDFFLREARAEDAHMVALVSAVAAQLGTAFQRRRAEDALRANRDYLNALLDTVGDAIFTVALPERRIEYANRAVREIFGYSPEEVVGQTTRLFYPDEAGYADYGRRLQEALERGEHTVRTELELRHKNGARLWCEIHTTFLLTDDQPRRIISILRDVTERKHAEEQLRLQAAANAADAVVITDREGIIRWINPAFTTLSGYAPEEAIGQNMRLIKSGLHDAEYYRKLWETILSGQVWRSEIVNRRKDGSFYEVEQTITPVRDARGEITHFVTIQRDITERRRHEHEVEAEALVAQALRETLELQPLLERLLAAAIHAIPGAEKGSILLVEAD